MVGVLLMVGVVVMVGVMDGVKVDVKVMVGPPGVGEISIRLGGIAIVRARRKFSTIASREEARWK
jgi:ATP-dependent Lon protease